jgi:hypothetical protein
MAAEAKAPDVTEAKRALDALNAQQDAHHDDPGLGTEGNATNTAASHGAPGLKGVLQMQAFKSVFSACPPLASKLLICCAFLRVYRSSFARDAGAKADEAAVEEEQIQAYFKQLEAEFAEADVELSALEAKFNIVRNHVSVFMTCPDCSDASARPTLLPEAHPSSLARFCVSDSKD